MSAIFRSQCMVAMALAGGGDQPSPLTELPIARFLEWCSAMGGKTVRVPTMSEVITVWESARKLGDCSKIEALWENRANKPVSFKDIDEALVDLLKEVPRCDHKRIREAARILFSAIRD